MANGFDAYYQWLGIAPKHQPPNHYRLLALEEFESNPDVIENATDLRMQHVRSFQNGPHGEASQRLLNEITAAKLCLLSAARKAEYDARLRAQREAAAARPQAQAIPVRPLDAYTDLGPPMPRPPAGAPVDAPSSASRPLRSGFSVEGQSIDADEPPPRISVAHLAAIVGGVLGVLVVAMIAMALSRRAGPTAAEKSSDKTVPPAGASSLDQSVAPGGEKSMASAAGPIANSPPDTIGEEKKPPDNKAEPASAGPPKATPPRLDRAIAERIKQAVASQQIVRTTKIGGNGGGDFSIIPKEGAVLVGTDCFVALYGGHPIIAGMRFHFLTAEGPWVSDLVGSQGGPTFSDRAPSGYAVSGIEARAGHFVDGFRFVYDPIGVPGSPGGQRKTLYGEWRGGMGGGPVDGTLKGSSVIGISGKCGGLLDSFSLVGIQEAKDK